MKNLIFIFIFFCTTGLLFAQGNIHVIEIDTLSSDLAEPRTKVVKAGEQIQFKTRGPEFAILILNAYEIFETDEVNIEILLNSDNLESDLFTLIRRDNDITKEYIIYCITNDSWIEAPPKIVLRRSD